MQFDIILGGPAQKDELVRQIIDMAFETEGLALIQTDVEQSVFMVFNNQNFGRYFLVTHENEYCGCLLITEEQSLHQKGIWIQSVNVKKEYRNKGVFRKLFNHVKEIAIKEQFQFIKLYVEKQNHIAQQVYNKIGMKQNDEIVYESDFVFHTKEAELTINVPDSKTSLLLDENKILEFIQRGKSLHGIDYSKLTKQEIAENVKANNNPYILFQSGTEFLMMLYMIEISDWRFGLTIWVYDFITDFGNPLDHEIIIQVLFNEIRTQAIRLVPDVRCIRIITKGVQVSKLDESNYYIFEKSL